MTAFLTQLAAIALGRATPGDAHVVLPPRFAPPAAALAHPRQTGWPPDEPAPGHRAPSTPSHPPRFGHRVADHNDDARPVFSPESKAPSVVRQETIAPHRPLPDSDVPQRNPPAPEPAPSNMLPPSSHDEVARPTSPAAKPVASERRPASAQAIVGLPVAPPVASMSRRDPAPLRAPDDAAPAQEIVGLHVAPPVAPSRRDPPPLSDAAMASRMSSPPKAPPVVHITIDRIDVRAPDVSRPAAPSNPARRQPAISLADYLRNSTRGSRA